MNSGDMSKEHDPSIKSEGYQENPQISIGMVERLFNRWKTEGIVMPEEQRVIYEKLSQGMIGQVVLDAGCGTGIGTNILSHNARFVWGIDVNPESVKFAQQIFTRPNIKFDTADLTNLPPREFAHFHQILCVDVIEHVDDYQAVLNSLKKFFRPGVTKLWISTPNRNNEKIQKDKPKNEFHVREWTLGEAWDILTKNFQHVTIYDHTLEKTIDLDDTEFLPVFKCEEVV
jgi:ubiquinone/menaquinone biosynthesis C-methylase UbiE